MTLLTVIIAGELIFSLPFHIPRFFRPTFLDVFQLSNSQLGDIFAVYGVVAMLSYFPGGVLADRFPPRKLMTYSLLATALGGVYLSTIPPYEMLYFLFGYWGCTSVLLFWAAMIKETRSLAGHHTQGFAFGLLDGGRGLVASIVASVAVLVLSFFIGQQNQSSVNNLSAMQAVIIFYSVMTFLAAILVWYSLPRQDNLENEAQKFSWEHLLQVGRKKTVWLQGGIIICAYCGYKALDNYGLYATQVLGMNQVDAAKLTAFASYARPIAAVAAGLLADRWHTGKAVMSFFVAAAVSYAGMSLLLPNMVPINWIMLNLVITFASVYALRGVYFALIEQSKLKLNVTGTAVGMISLIGYTPDIFFASLTGRILDANPGFIGFQNYFLLLAAISTIGLVFAHRLNLSTLRLKGSDSAKLM